MIKPVFASQLNPRQPDGLPDNLAQKAYSHALREHARVLMEDGQPEQAMAADFKAQQIELGLVKLPRKAGRVIKSVQRVRLYPNRHLASMIDNIKRRLGL
jgi:hypothetical protein